MKIVKKKVIEPEELYQAGKMFQDQDGMVFLVCESAKNKQLVVVNLTKNTVIDPFDQQQFLIQWRETFQTTDKPFYGQLIELEKEE